MKVSGIVVSGQSYIATFALPPDVANIPTDAKHHFTDAAIFSVRAGSPFIAAAINGLSTPDKVCLVDGPGQYVNKSLLFTLRNVDPTNKIKEPELRFDGDSLPFQCFGYNPSSVPIVSNVVKAQLESSIYVQWFSASFSALSASSPKSCYMQIQIGGLSEFPPHRQAAPKYGRILVTSLQEASQHHRIRKALSYEAMAVDFLRAFRGSKEEPEWPDGDGLFNSLYRPPAGQTWECSFPGRLEKFSEQPSEQTIRYYSSCVLILRFSNSAAMAYWLTWDADCERYIDHARFFYHKEHAAPTSDLDLGSMNGFSDFLGAYIAHGANSDWDGVSWNLFDDNFWLWTAIARGIILDSKISENGFFRLLFHKHPNATGYEPIDNIEWTNERQMWFNELKMLPNGIEDIKNVSVDIPEAVSYRKHWFIAKQLVRKVDPAKAIIQRWEEHRPIQAEERKSDRQRLPPNLLSQCFFAQGLRWLSEPGASPSQDFPLVSLGKLALIDRAEIEDFLSIQQALIAYSTSQQKNPLNLAVFGPPGAGKSFGVKEVAEHIRMSYGGFKEKPITFNLSQFTKLEDLMMALHQVRNACLGDKLSIIFFDEFDCTFGGRPFGWLKFFLAPMQDGEFNEGGVTHKLSRCVFVFAGGVNRTFEELNSRLRNLEFVESKGPDFISRLRGHLNIRGVNKPEDEVDQGRYLLRRAVVLHGKLMEELRCEGSERLPLAGLMSKELARAFLRVSRFKHGVRSMEAILRMCELRRGRTITASDLPTGKQLEMHVDASEFIRHLCSDCGDWNIRG